MAAELRNWFSGPGLAACLAVSAVAPAHAAGGLWCDADDATLKIEVVSGVTHGMGGPFFDFKARVDLKAEGVMQELRVNEFPGGPVHSWIDGEEVKLSLYREIDKENSIYSMALIIDTKMEEDSDGSYVGEYRLSYYGPPAKGTDDSGMIEAAGKVTCGMD